MRMCTQGMRVGMHKECTSAPSDQHLLRGRPMPPLLVCSSRKGICMVRYSRHSPLGSLGLYQNDNDKAPCVE